MMLSLILFLVAFIVNFLLQDLRDEFIQKSRHVARLQHLLEQQINLKDKQYWFFNGDSFEKRQLKRDFTKHERRSNRTLIVQKQSESDKKFSKDLKFYQKLLLDSRLNFMGDLGRSSVEVRIKAIKVSLINSFPNMWFGNGAGTSQLLLPKMGRDYDIKLFMNNLTEISDKQIDENPRNYRFFTGDSFEKMLEVELSNVVYNNRTLIDSHNII